MDLRVIRSLALVGIYFVLIQISFNNWYYHTKLLNVYTTKVLTTATVQLAFITFRVRRSQGEMYIENLLFTISGRKPSNKKQTKYK